MREKSIQRSSSKKAVINGSAADARGSGWTTSTITGAKGRKSSKTASGKKIGDRPQAHSRRRHSTNWLQVVEVTVLLLVVCGLTWYLLTNKKFMIRQIHIDGIQTLKVSHIAAAADVPRNSNVFLFLIEQRSSFCRRIVACDPVINSASVAIDFPNSLRLHIVERQPYSVLRLASGASYLMDSNRIAYRSVALNQADLPIIAVPASSEALFEGRSLPASLDHNVLSAYNLLSLIESRRIGELSDVEEVFVDEYNNVSVRLHNQLIIKLGQPDGLPDRLALLETALDGDPGLASKAEYLDFTTSRPAIMPRQSVPEALGDITPTELHPGQ